MRMERCRNHRSRSVSDHIHMLVAIPPKMAVWSFMGYLKGKRSTMLYEQFGELKDKYRNREFWYRYDRKKHESNCGVYQEPVKRRRAG